MLFVFLMRKSMYRFWKENYYDFLVITGRRMNQENLTPPAA